MSSSNRRKYVFVFCLFKERALKKKCKKLLAIVFYETRQIFRMFLKGEPCAEKKPFS